MSRKYLGNDLEKRRVSADATSHLSNSVLIFTSYNDPLSVHKMTVIFGTTKQ